MQTAAHTRVFRARRHELSERRPTGESRLMSSEHPSDFLCKQTGPHQFSISPCTLTVLAWLHEHVLQGEANYDGKPITLDIPAFSAW